MKTYVFVCITVLVLSLLAACSGNTLAGNAPAVFGPTATPTPGQNTEAAETLGAALAKNGDLSSYRMRSQMTITDPTSSESITISDISGEFRGQDFHLVTQDHPGISEFLKVGDRAFQKNESGGDLWSPIDKSIAERLRSNFNPRTLFEQYIAPSDWASGTTQTLDGIECQVLAQDRYAAAQTYCGLLWFAPCPRELLDSQLQEAEGKAWVCSDGYLHQLTLVVAFKDWGRLNLSSRVFDLNKDFENVIRDPRPEERTPARWENYDPAASYLFFHRFSTGGAYLGRIDRTDEWHVAPDSRGLVQVSPDGKRVAYNKYCGDSESPTDCIYISNIDGSDEHMVARGETISWSPDGCRVLGRNDLGNNRYDHFVVNADGKIQAVACTEDSPKWMPDNTGIACLLDDKFNIYELETGKTSTIPLPVGEGEPASPPVTPGRIQVEIGASEGEPASPPVTPGRIQVEIGASEGEFSYSDVAPDGTHLAIGRLEASTADVSDSVIYIIDPKTGRNQRVEGSFVRAPIHWSPDSRQLAYTLTTPGESRMFVLDLDGESRLIGTWSQMVSIEEWSPDGTEILFRVHGVPGEIGSVKTDETGQVVFTVEGDSARWSPDGRQIAFDRDDKIFVMNADGSAARELYEGYAPEWLPTMRDTKCEP